jgi:hypothetical protein
MTMNPLQRKLANAYRAGWNASGGGKAPRRHDSLDEAEDEYAGRGRTSAQQDAFSAGWIDYGADFEKGHALAPLLDRAATT